jgi:hypothetical protein
MGEPQGCGSFFMSMDGRYVGNAGAIADGVERRLALGVRRLTLARLPVESEHDVDNLPGIEGGA